LSLPGFVGVIIWHFTQIWNEFLFAVTLTRTDYSSSGAVGRGIGSQVVVILAALLTLLLYILLGRFFI
jgi:glucose/mannose transport system permease protein